MCPMLGTPLLRRFALVTTAPFDFSRTFAAFCCSSLYVKPQVLSALAGIRAECVDAAQKRVFSTQASKASFLKPQKASPPASRGADGCRSRALHFTRLCAALLRCSLQALKLEEFRQTQRAAISQVRGPGQVFPRSNSQGRKGPLQSDARHPVLCRFPTSCKNRGQAECKVS